MMEKLAELIWKILEPRMEEVIQKAYTKGGEDVIRRFAYVYDAVGNKAREDAYADMGMIPIEEISREMYEELN